MYMNTTDFLWAPAVIKDWTNIHAELTQLPIATTNVAFKPTDDLTVYRSLLPSLFAWFESIGVEAKCVASVEVGPYGRHKLHIDRTEGFDPQLALNLPICGCDDAYTAIYHTSKPPQMVITTHTRAYVYDPAALTEVGRYVLLQPVWLGIKHPHRVINPGPLTRHSLSVRFACDPWHLLDN